MGTEPASSAADGAATSASASTSASGSDPLLFKFKICLLGDPGVGKTSLIQRFVYDVFTDVYLSTIGTKVSKKEIEVPYNGHPSLTKLLIWDIMGQQEFHKLHSLYFKDARGAIIVSDIQRKETLANIPKWVSELYDISPNVPLVLVTNKRDLDRDVAVSDDELMEVAEAFMAPYYFTSAKTGENVETIFCTLVRSILKRVPRSRS